MTQRLRNYGPVETHTSTDAIDRMWDVLHRRRDGTKNVSVSVDDLTALLKDHAKFCDVVKTTN